MENPKHYDVLLKQGTVIDPASGHNQVMDVALKDGRIAAISRDPISASAEHVLDVAGKLVVPGLIDLHIHAYKDVSVFGVEVDDLCPQTGVTTAVDTGSAGHLNYQGLERYVIEPSQTRILAYVNLSGVGLPSLRGELINPDYINPAECARCVEEHPETALGVKVRLYAGVGGDADLRDLLGLALDAANRCRKPLMVHITNADIPLEDILAPLRPGDIITHCFHEKGIASILDTTSRVKPIVRDARDRGILFDVGHGQGSLTFNTARRALDDGFAPDTISTDIHSFNLDGPVYDLPTTMSKFLNLGMPLEEVIRRTTIEPARVIGRESDLGHLGVGAIGDISILAHETGAFNFLDASGQTLCGDQRLVCKASLRRGSICWQEDHLHS